MSRSMVLGLLFGVVLTATLAHYVTTSELVKKAPKTTTAPTAEMVGVTDTAEPDSPPPTMIGYSTEFGGSDDAIAHRAKLKPRISTDAWDQTLRASKISVSVRTTNDCRNVESEKAISIPVHDAEAVAKGEINVHFVEGRVARCYGTGTKLSVLVDDLTGGSLMYNILGEATIDRVVSIAHVRIPPLFLREMGANIRDVAFFANPNASARRSSGNFFILHYTFSPQQPIVDATKVPPFYPGVISLKADALKRYFENFSNPEKPVFIDARDRRNISSGDSYPGAIKVPFISSNPIQLRFQLGLPLSVGAGAKFDLRLLPTHRNTPLVIFGNDSGDAAPLWTIRYLRQLNYRSIFLVEGGLKALNDVKPTVSL